ncbi:hypothetical protein MYCTH_46877, partial [Thermothelomyces thermophilus ATCC 42464]
KIELPSKYGGTKEDLVGFLTNLRSYFRLNNDKFPDDKAKVLYVAIRLEAIRGRNGRFRLRHQKTIRITRQTRKATSYSLLFKEAR